MQSPDLLEPGMLGDMRAGKRPNDHLLADWGDAMSAAIRAREALQASEARYRLLAENSSDIIARLTPDCIFTYVSPACESLLGYRADALVGRNCYDYFHPHDLDEHVKARAALIEGSGTQTVEHRMRRQNGEYRWFETTIRSVRDAGGAIVELQAAIRDISKRKLAEQAQQNAESLLRSVVQRAPVVLFALDREGTFTLHEGGALKNQGLLPGTAVGESVFSWLADTPSTAGIIQAALDGKAFTTIVEVHDRAYEVWWMPACDGDVPYGGGTGMAVDVTDTVHAQRDAERAEVAARELADLRSDFVAAVSHELRTPLTSIIGYGELLQTYWERLSDEHRRERLERILLAANRQKRLVEDMITVMQLEAESMQPRREPSKIGEAARHVADEVMATYAGQSITLAGSDDLAAVADPDRLRQILSNVIDNAAKHSPEGCPIAVTWTREGDRAVVRVRDRGAGIAEDRRARLFTRFGRVPGSQMRAGRVGTGLGLYLGREYARAMGGELELEYSGAEGSVFRLLLPVVAAP